MEYKTITYEVENNVCVITLNRPETYNAISEEMCKDLIQALRHADSDNNVRALLLKSNGKAFSSGGDINDMKVSLHRSTTEILEFVNGFTRMAKQLINFSKPTICAAHGAVAGAGFSIVLACDITIAAENVRLMQAFGNVGLLPDSGSCYLLARIVGLSRAKELVFSRRMVEAEEAKSLGIVHQIVPLEELETTAMNLAEQYATGPTRAFALAKGIINASQESTLDQVLDSETYRQTALFATEDFREGVAAFLEKRKPEFKGK
ncbi:MAG TPA: hypothetical protein GX717_04605 [Clostridiaceae bacterium]|nr:hypothetical protein [Clostridiaceae bacterium]